MGSTPTIKRVPNGTWLTWGTAVLWSGFFQNQLFWGLLWAWGISFMMLQIINPKVSLSANRQIFIWLALGTVTLYGLSQQAWETMLDDENLHGLTNRLADKAALENPPLLFPRHLLNGTPQDFYIYAPDSTHASLELGNHRLEGLALGRGLFRVAVRNSLSDIESELIPANLLTETGSHIREMEIVKPLPHPQVSCGNGSSQAYLLSDKTDTLTIVNQLGIVATVPTGNGPSGCVQRGDRLYVSHAHENFIWEFNTTSHAVIARHDVQSPQRALALSLDGEILAATLTGPQQGVALASLQAPQGIQYISLSHKPEWIVAGPSAQTWLVSSREQPALIRIQQLDKGWQQTQKTLSRPLITMVGAKQGHSLYAAATGYSISGEALRGNHYIQDQILEFDTASLEVTGRLLTHKRAEKAKAPG
ncbi:MAG: hypothetical protein HOK97_13160, partial [Deltaproteobacteria bacterium]|nr:hypothetical protein [Deltaproteobacteria bacterium]